MPGAGSFASPDGPGKFRSKDQDAVCQGRNQPPPGVRHHPAAQTRFDVGFTGPVARGRGQRRVDRKRHPCLPSACVRSGFDQQDIGRWIRAQPCCKRATGRPAATLDVIELLLHDCRYSRRGSMFRSPCRQGQADLINTITYVYNLISINPASTQAIYASPALARHFRASRPGRRMPLFRPIGAREPQKDCRQQRGFSESSGLKPIPYRGRTPCGSVQG